MKASKFYSFHQNNSGGGFDILKINGIGHIVVVEAYSWSDAVDRAESIGLYFDGVLDGRDCECCGDRWSRYCDESDSPMPDYGHISEEQAGDSHMTFVHYLDGSFKRLP